MNRKQNVKKEKVVFGDNVDHPHVTIFEHNESWIQILSPKYTPGYGPRFDGGITVCTIEKPHDSDIFERLEGYASYGARIAYVD